jgi:hypothetical protein
MLTTLLITLQPAMLFNTSRLLLHPLAVALCLAGFALTPAAQAQSPAAAAASAVQPARTVRPEFAAVVQAAQTLSGEGKHAEALAKLGEAEALPNRTPWETWVLERNRASAAQRAGNNARLLQALDAALTTGQAEPAEERSLIEALVNIASREKDHPRVLRWSQRYEEIQGTNDGVRVMRIQALADSGDQKGAIAALQQRAEAAEKAGQAAPESHLRMLLGLQYLQKDAGSAATLQRLAMVYPRPEYWADLVTAAARDPNLGDRALLELYRLLRATGSLNRADMRYEMAQLALRVGQPGEALAVLEEGYSAGVLGTGKDGAEHNKLRDQARRGAAADKADRAAAEAAAKRAPDGSALADLGWTLVAEAPVGAPPSAIEPGLALIELGVAKGGLKRASAARLHLAMAQWAAGRKDAAKQTLSALAASSGSDELAAPIRLWSQFVQAPAMLPPR